VIERVVFDTSTLVGAALKVGSTPWTALDLAFERCHVFVSSDTISELQDALSRRRIAKYVPRAGREEFVAWYRSNTQLVAAPELKKMEIKPRCRDPKDDKFLALASASRAQTIVSSDHDLLVLHPWNGVAIMSPAQFRARFAP
jgi:putative PIN family toxin of toxin-antitoxin system